MDNKGEKQLEEFRLNNEAEFRRKHNISREEWDMAENMTADLIRELYKRFWETFRAIPPANNLRPAERPAPRHRKRRPGPRQRD